VPRKLETGHSAAKLVSITLHIRGYFGPFEARIRYSSDIEISDFLLVFFASRIGLYSTLLVILCYNNFQTIF
jgi:hypothetical protein